MYIELLRSPPISGMYTERHFDVSARSNTWVRFEGDEGEAWVGVFGRSELAAFDAVVPIADDGGRTVLVIAGSQGYIVDVAAGTLVRQTPWAYAYAAIAVPGRDFVLVADVTCIWASSRTEDRLAWRRDRAWYDSEEVGRAHRLALDGIVFDDVTSETLTGKVWEMDGWYAFRVRLPDLEFVRGELLTADWEPFGLRAPAG
jgi:hypothetical protein